MPIELSKLFQSTLKYSPKRKKFTDNPRIRVDRVIPFAGTNTCLFQCSMQGITQGRVRHRVNILAVSIDVSRVDNNDKSYFKTTDKNIDFYVKKPSPKKDLFRVRCTCLDHYFTWGIWNFFKGYIFGDKPKAYKRKTPPPPLGYPYRNPKKINGMCKHIKQSVDLLISNGFFEK